MKLPVRYALTFVLAGAMSVLVGVNVYYDVDDTLGVILTFGGLAVAAFGLVLLVVYAIVRFVKASAKD